MKQKMEQKIEIPEGIVCTFADNTLTCKKDSVELKREIRLPLTVIKVEGNQVTLTCEKGNKTNHKRIMANLAHITNIFRGLKEKFVYHLEVVYVHFPISLKVEGSTLTIKNFFGEKKDRSAKILPDVEVDIKGQKITISSPNKEAAGQTAANFEKATKVKGKDKRIYQDGIYIVEKPHGGKNA